MQITVSVPGAGDIAVLQGMQQKMDQVAEAVGTVKRDVGTIAQAVQERLSATVPASKMPKEKLVELRSALGGALYPAEGSGELLSNLLGPELHESDAQFTW